MSKLEPRIPGGGGGGGGVLTPNFGRYVPRQSEKWARAPERAPGQAWKAGLRIELEPFWAWKCGAAERAWYGFERENASLRNCQDVHVSGWRSGRPLTRSAAELGLSRPWEGMNGLKLRTFWKIMVSGTAKSAKKLKLWCSGADFFCNLWTWYAPERKFRAENGDLSRGTYRICIRMEVPPPPPGARISL